MIAPKISTQGARLIAAERQRQITQEGWAPEHDDDHTDGALLLAAVEYIQHVQHIPDSGECWPWARESWKPSADPIRNLVKAGALIAAEIDRLTRANEAARRRDDVRGLPAFDPEVLEEVRRFYESNGREKQ